MATNKLLDYSGVLAGVFGALAFFSVFLLGGSFPFAAGGAVGVFVISWMVLSPRQKKPNPLSTLSLELQEDILKAGRKNLEEMSFWVERIVKPSAKAHAIRILSYAEKIVNELERDPRDIPAAKSFLNYYFPTVTKILRQYVELKGKSLSGSSIEESLNRVEASLARISETFQHQYEKLLSNDLLDLDVELKVLEQTIHFESNQKGGKNE